MSFISPTAAASFSKDYDDFFVYFSRPFVVHKEPIKVLESVQSPTMYGYGSSSDSANYTYIPVNATFNGRIYYNNARDVDAVNSDLKLVFARGDVTLKVKQDANTRRKKLLVSRKPFVNTLQELKQLSSMQQKNFLQIFGDIF